MIGKFAATALMLTTATRAAQDIHLAGSLVDELGQPVAGATVSLDGLSATVVSGTDGGFVLTGSSSDIVSVRNTVRSTGISVAMRNGSVRLIGAQDGSAWTLDAFLPDGRTLARNLAFVDGVARLPNQAAGRTVIRLFKDGKLATGWNGTSTASFREASTSGWTLRFSKTGFAPERRSLQALDVSGISDTLIASDPWIPSSALVHQGGQVKISAKDHSFAMGSDLTNEELLGADPNLSEDQQLNPAENPRHSVKFTYDFWMDTTEVTQAAWQEAMSSHYGARFSPVLMSAAFGMGDDYPAYAVFEEAWTAGGAILYANALSKIDGLDSVYTYASVDGIGNSARLEGVVADLSKNGYRLPNEAEWEYAARGGTTSDTYWGQEFSTAMTAADSANLSAHAVWAGNSLAKDQGNPGYGANRVATKPPNAYGLYDMLGNLSEWCNNSWYSEYLSGPSTDWTGSDVDDTRSYHAVRGGNWGSPAHLMRVSNRTFYTPAYQSYFAGFRLVRRAE